MKTDQATPKTIDEYIAGFPKEVQARLKEIRKTIRKAAPAAEEKISYRIPAFALHGNLIYFAAFKNHIALYPAPRGVAKFKDELSAYEGGKGTVQFPLDRPIPFDLISRIVKFRVEENLAGAKTKPKAKTKTKARTKSKTRVRAKAKR